MKDWLRRLRAGQAVSSLQSLLPQVTHSCSIKNISLEMKGFPQQRELNANSIKYIKAYLYVQDLVNISTCTFFNPLMFFTANESLILQDLSPVSTLALKNFKYLE